jgi:peroxiredoxin Q/BCP
MPKAVLGRKLPPFSVQSTAGTFRPRDVLGSKLVIYFYPRDNTPGCTREGEAFRDLHGQFRRSGTLVLGVSPDSLASHEKFRDKMKFPFALAADEDRRLAGLFGVWKEKNMYGRKVMGIERSTFLVDAAGVLRQEWRKVRVDGHAEAVLAAARAL